MNNTIDFKNFQSMRRNENKVNEAITGKVNEQITVVDDVYRIMSGKGIEVPAALVSAFTKKVKDESGQNIKQQYSEMQLAELIADYITSNFMTIENIPVSVVLGSDYSSGGAQVQDVQDVQGLQGQPPQAQFNAQGQPQAQPGGAQLAQPVQGVQGQSGAQTPPPPQSQVQRTAAQIPQGI